MIQLRTSSLRFRPAAIALAVASLLCPPDATLPAESGPPPGHEVPVESQAAGHVFGFRDFSRQASIDSEFLAVPDPALARQHLRVLTALPHPASSPQDFATAQYVAAQFKAAGLQTAIVPYTVLISKPGPILIEAFDAGGKKIMSGPSREHVGPSLSGEVDHFQDNPDILPAYNSSSATGDVTAPVVYANYGRLEDFQRLAQLGVSMKGKIALVRYGINYRGVKAFIAQQFGAKGVLIYSDPADDGYHSGAVYPNGPWRPESGVQRGSVQFLPQYPGDPTTPGIASVPGLPESKRIPRNKLQADIPSIPVNPLSWGDAAPILRALSGPGVPAGWQGGLPFPYHAGGAPSVIVHMHLVNDSRLRTIWDVIGTIPGASQSGQIVIAGNHRDAWVYGAVDPGSGTAAMLETVHGLGVLLAHGWRPRRTIIIASWDAEEEGLIGSTEWVEQHMPELAHAVAYFNVDVAVSGPVFNAAAVPALDRFLREVAHEPPAAAGGTVLEQWQRGESQPHIPEPGFDAAASSPLRIGDLGSGSDYTPFFQHAGVPSTDIGSDGPYGVYHSTFDDFDWYTRFADPTFTYNQQQARFLGLEVLHMADADVLPFDYRAYARDILGYINDVEKQAEARGMHLDFSAAKEGAESFSTEAGAAYRKQIAPTAHSSSLNCALAATEHALLIPEGLPGRPWYKHSIYAPGEFTGYAAVELPGVTEAVEARNAPRAQQQLDALAQALDRAAHVLRQSPQ